MKCKKCGRELTQTNEVDECNNCKYTQMTQQQIMFVNANPDEMYPIRILQAYLDNTDCRWATETDGSCNNVLFELMNKHCEERAVILRKAINVLQKHYLKDLISDQNKILNRIEKISSDLNFVLKKENNK